MPGLPLTTASTCAEVGPFVHLGAAGGAGVARVGATVGGGVPGYVGTVGYRGYPTAGRLAPGTGYDGALDGAGPDGYAYPDGGALTSASGGAVGNGSGGTPQAASMIAMPIAGTSRRVGVILRNTAIIVERDAGRCAR
jgi:hypothetical protein